MAHLTKEEWQAQRDKMLNIRTECHSRSYAKTNLESADAMIKEADKLMAEAIEIVAGIYIKGYY